MEITITKNRVSGFDVVANGGPRVRAADKHIASEIAGDAFGNAGYGLGRKVARETRRLLAYCEIVDLESSTGDNGLPAVEVNASWGGLNGDGCFEIWGYCTTPNKV